MLEGGCAVAGCNGIESDEVLLPSKLLNEIESILLIPSTQRDYYSTLDTQLTLGLDGVGFDNTFPDIA